MDIKKTELVQYNIAEALKDISQVDTANADLHSKLLLANAQCRLSAINNDMLLKLYKKHCAKQEAVHDRYVRFDEMIGDQDLQQAQAADLLSSQTK